MPPLVETYIQALSSTLDPDNKKNLGFIVWGSAGNNTFSENSDLDLWIISPENLSFEHALQISSQEYAERAEFGKKHNLPYFARHRASIFSQEEAQTFLQSFYWRYYLPLTQFKEAQVWNYSIPKCTVSQEEMQLDLITTLQERLESFSHSKKEKLLSYNLRDYSYFSGLKIPSYLLSPSTSENKNVSQYIELHARQPFLKLAWKRQTHALLWTMEKVRWELFNVYEDKNYFEAWKHGTHNGYGYSLPALGNFLFQLMLSKRCHITPQVKDIGRSLTQLIHEESADLIPHIYELLSGILVQALTPDKQKTPSSRTYSVTLPIVDRSETHICKISNDERYIISEYEGQQRYAPSSPKEVSLGNISYIISPVIHGQTYHTKDMHILIDLLKQTHTQKGNFFGRVGTGPYFSSFTGFIQNRIECIPTNVKFYQPLLTIFHILKDKLSSLPSVACHMDPHPGNIIINKHRSTLIDWEHFSFCAREWDVERAIFDYPEEEQNRFRALYFGSEKYDRDMMTFIRIVVLGTFASKLPKSERRSRLFTLCTTLTHDLHTTLSQGIHAAGYQDRTRADFTKNSAGTSRNRGRKLEKISAKNT